MPLSFRGGVHPDDKKADTRKKAIEVLPAPGQVVLPVSMHIGAPAAPVVSVGEHVKMGQVVAETAGAVSARVHATVSGTVTAIEPRPHPNGTNVMSIVIENDYNDELFEGIKPVDRFHSIDAQELADIAEAAGIVGLGGAMFPTHVKISSSVGKVDTLIINGAECEPYITSDNRQMLECGEEIINGVTLLMKALKLDTAYIAIESNKRSAIEKIRRLIAKKDGLKLKVLRTKYPQGAEKQLIKSVCGREVPPGGLPSAVGVLNINVGTVIALSRAVETGMPLLTKVVTVSGSAVANPKNLLARIGTPLRELFSAAGGFKDNPYKVLMGGPMMGISQYSLDVPVIKGTNAILAFCEKEDAYSEQQVCIRCGKCVGACPMNLMPVYLHMYGNRGMLDECEKLNVTDCIECGCCSYICPGRLHLVQSFKNTKQRLAALKKKKGAR